MHLLVQIQALELALRTEYVHSLNTITHINKSNAHMWRWELKYLWGAIDGLPAVHGDVAQSVVAIQLNRVKLAHFDGVGIAYGGHARANVKPTTASEPLSTRSSS